MPKSLLSMGKSLSYIALGDDGTVYVVDAWARSVRKYTTAK
jgi:hypothetical protein